MFKPQILGSKIEPQNLRVSLNLMKMGTRGKRDLLVDLENRDKLEKGSKRNLQNKEQGVGFCCRLFYLKLLYS